MRSLVLTRSVYHRYTRGYQCVACVAELPWTHGVEAGPHRQWTTAFRIYKQEFHQDDEWIASMYGRDDKGSCLKTCARLSLIIAREKKENEARVETTTTDGLPYLHPSLFLPNQRNATHHKTKTPRSVDAFHGGGIAGASRQDQHRRPISERGAGHDHP